MGEGWWRASSGRGLFGSFLLAMAVVGSLAVTQLADSASAYPRILDPRKGAHFGAFVRTRGSESSRDAVVRLERKIDRRLGIDHQYYSWNASIPTDHQTWDRRHGRIPFVNWNAQRTDGRVVAWNAIADGSHDDWIRRRAGAFRRFDAPIYLTFHHEPEDDVGTFGTADDFAAAFRRIVTIFREEDVSNVAFVWTMMAWTFDPGSDPDAMAFYPGDRYVDLIGSDGYNWHGVRSGEPWRNFGTIFAETRAFARARHKPWIIVEYGVVEDADDPGRKAQWFRLAGQKARTWGNLAGLVYFDSTKSGNEWVSDSSQSSIVAFRHVGLRNYFVR